MTTLFVGILVLMLAVLFVAVKRPTNPRAASIPIKFMRPSRKGFMGKIKPGTQRYKQQEARKRMSARSRQNNFRMSKGMRKV